MIIQLGKIANYYDPDSGYESEEFGDDGHIAIEKMDHDLLQVSRFWHGDHCSIKLIHKNELFEWLEWAVH